MKASWTLLLALALFPSASRADLNPTAVDCGTELNDLDSFSPALKKTIRDSLNPRIRLAGGYNGSGGEGLACFDSREKAEQALDDQGKLKADWRPKVTRVIAYDVFKFRDRYWPVPPARGESPEDYLDRAIDQGIGADLPELGRKLKETLSRLNRTGSLHDWDDVGAIPKLDDGESSAEDEATRRARTNAITELPGKDGSSPEYCRRVQVAIRYSERNPSGKWPKAFVDMDGDLMRRMANGPSWADNILFSSTVRAHEPLYMAAMVLGMPDSVATHEFISLVLAGNVAEKIHELPPALRAQLWLDRFGSLGFGKLPALLAAPTSGPTNLYPKDEARAAFSAIPKAQIESAQALGISLTTPFTDADVARIHAELPRHLTSQQAFLQSMQILRGARGASFGADPFLEDGIRNHHHVRLGCAEIRGLLAPDGAARGDIQSRPETVPGLIETLQKALPYCDQATKAN